MKLVINIFRKCLTAMMAVITGVNVVTIVMQVLLRYFFKKPIAWTNELAGISLVWITFLGATLATIDETHIGFDAVIKKLAPAPKLCLRLTCNLLMSVACYVIIRYGIVAVRVGLKTSLTVLPGNVAMTSVIIPVSGVIMLVAIVLNSARDIRAFITEKKGVATEASEDHASLYADVPEDVLRRSEAAFEAHEKEGEG